MTASVEKVDELWVTPEPPTEEREVVLAALRPERDEPGESLGPWAAAGLREAMARSPEPGFSGVSPPQLRPF